MAPPLALAIAAAGAYAAPIVIRSWTFAFVVLGATLVAILLASVGTAGLQVLDSEKPPGDGKPERRWQVAGGVALVALGASLALPLHVPPAIGTVGVLAVMLAVVALAGGELGRWAETRAPPRGLAGLGFAHTPVIGLVLLTFTAASFFDADDDHHDVHRDKKIAASPKEVALKTVWERWKKTNCATRKGAGTPMVIVASHGGGVRAAYWTASVMTDLLGDADRPIRPGCVARPIDRVIAMSGISGGSLGLTSYMGHVGEGDGWYRAALGEPDFLSSPVAWLAVDTARASSAGRGRTAPACSRRRGSAMTRRSSRTSSRCRRRSCCSAARGSTADAG